MPVHVFEEAAVAGVLPIMPKDVTILITQESATWPLPVEVTRTVLSFATNEDPCAGPCAFCAAYFTPNGPFTRRPPEFEDEYVRGASYYGEYEARKMTILTTCIMLNRTVR